MRSLRPFIRGHITEILTSYLKVVDSRTQQGLRRSPFDSYLRDYYHHNKALGPSERSIVTDTIYKYMRNDLLLAHLARSSNIDAKLSQLTRPQELWDALKNDNIPFHIRCSCPKELFEILAHSYGQRTAFDYLLNFNDKAPLTIRVNPIKGTRQDLYPQLRARHEQIRLTEFSPYGITFLGTQQPNLKDTPQFREGLFEIQDEASQLCALKVACKPKQRVLDYCAGSGGKTLAFAHQMEGTGQIVLHDVREEMLEKAKRRCARAQIQNIRLTTDYRQLRGMKYDWILLDVPCSGIGTLRRNPDLKLFFSTTELSRIIHLQREIFEKAVPLLKPDGKLVYVTCSLLKEENQDQLEHLCSVYNMKVCNNEVFQSFPKKGGMDSFFSATLEFQ